MIRVFDMSVEMKDIDKLLDDPNHFPTKLKVSCSETGYTTLFYRGEECDEPREVTYLRRFRRFILFGGKSEPLMHLLKRKDIRILKEYEFFTEQGTIIVVDYETTNEE